MSLQLPDALRHHEAKQPVRVPACLNDGHMLCHQGFTCGSDRGLVPMPNLP